MSYILIVENDETIREILSLALTNEGYEVRIAPHGAAALACLDEHPPALILLDTRMPVMDGWEFVRVYHKAPGPHVPIIGLSADSKPLGTTAQLAKPFSLFDLLELIRQYTSQDAD